MKFGKWLLLLLVAGGIAVPRPAQSQTLSEDEKRAITEANPFVERGNKFVQDNSLPRAKAEYTKALKVYPKHVDALYNLAVVCEKLNENEEAISLYQRYLEIRPKDADVWTQIGVCNENLGRKTEARSAYEKALAANEGFGRAHHNLGVICQDSGEWEAAEKHLKRYLELCKEQNADISYACYSLGALHLRRGQIKEAKLLLQQAIDADPGQVYYHNAMGDVYLAEKNYSLARVSYQKAIEKDKTYAPAYSGLGDVYRLEGQREKSAENYQQALKLRPQYHLVQFKLGLLYADFAPPQAIKYFEKYLASGTNLEFEAEAKKRLEQLKTAKETSTEK